MDNLIARVAAAANTTPETARQAVALIVDFLKREAPDDAIQALRQRRRSSTRSSPRSAARAARGWARSSRD